MIPEPKCLVCGHKLHTTIHMRPLEPPAYECERCGFLIAQHLIETLTHGQDNAP